ncbi:MAG: hypothetical protein MJA84_16175 [Firmicutes bacterium]|nr:hypothetical protein [Bacillota bacterium]
MAYFSYLSRLYRFDFSVFTPGELPARPFLSAFCNVLVAGLLYGVSSLLLNLEQLAVFTDAFSRNVASFLIILSGVLVALVVHAGGTLFIWTFCRGVGGSTGLLNYYVGTGFAVPLLWPALPFLAAFGAGYTDLLVLAVLAVGAAAFLAALVASLREVSGLRTARLAAALSLTAVFVGCFLYLWL